jgi:hypothetical protein
LKFVSLSLKLPLTTARARTHTHSFFFDFSSRCAIESTVIISAEKGNFQMTEKDLAVRVHKSTPFEKTILDTSVHVYKSISFRFLYFNIQESFIIIIFWDGRLYYSVAAGRVGACHELPEAPPILRGSPPPGLNRRSATEIGTGGAVGGAPLGSVRDPALCAHCRRCGEGRHASRTARGSLSRMYSGIQLSGVCNFGRKRLEMHIIKRLTTFLLAEGDHMLQ